MLACGDYWGENNPQPENEGDSNPTIDQPAGETPSESKIEEGAPPIDSGKADAGAASTAMEFDLGGKKYKSGYALTEEDVKSFSRAVLRDKDYTTKTQRLAEIQNAYNNAYNRMQNDDAFFLKYFPRERLMKALGGVGDNQFTKTTEPTHDDLGEFEPQAAQIIRDLRGQVKGLNEKLGQYDNRLKDYDDRFKSNDEKIRDEAAKKDMQAEMQDVLKVYPQLNTQLDQGYLWHIIGLNPQLSILQAAEMLDTQKRQIAGNANPLNSTRQKTKMVPPGGSVPKSGQQTFKTMEEADRETHAIFGVPFNN